MDKRGNLQNVGYPVFFTPGAIAKLSFICDGEVTFKFLLDKRFGDKTFESQFSRYNVMDKKLSFFEGHK